ncbi:Cyclin_fold protein [Hexamita inflata]|uniref:Cyclin fold protein n=1 Tax=Hexamita inflata TaxID=28002 RepID=A0AA86Q145_9EUKA|nr:Cyclin fold protein [Hexamita inflata]
MNHRTSINLAKYIISQMKQVSFEISSQYLCFMDPFEDFSFPTFYKYILRIFSKGRMEPESLIVAAKYVHDFSLVSSVPLNKFTVKRITLCAMIMANSFVDDCSMSTLTYSKICNIQPSELEMMIGAFCSAIDFKFFVNVHDYTNWFQISGRDNILVQ